MNSPIIEVKKLSKKFPSNPSEYAVKGISFSLQPGDIFGIVGASGAGKSTLMRCLTGLEKPTSGFISIEGTDIASLTTKELIPFRQKFGMVFQHFNLFPSKDVASNIAFPMAIYGVPKHEQMARVDELLELVGLTHRKHAYPAMLSGGEKQRVGIARALANHPHILFCDEATSALDPTSTRSILQLLLSLNEKLQLTIVVITHELEAVKNICNRMAVLHRGEIVEQGLVADIFAKPTSPATKQLLHPLSEQLPRNFLEAIGPNSRLVSLTFKGEQAKKPIISHMIKLFDVDVNILLAGIDAFQKTVLGSLVVELKGDPGEIIKVLDFLHSQNIECEVIA